MTFEQRVDMKKPWALIASLAMILAFFTIAVLLIRAMSAPVSATPPAAGPSYHAANEQLLSNAEEAAQMPAAAQVPAEQVLAEQAPRGPAAPDQDTDEPTADKVSTSEQRTFKSRRALETIDPRELLRRAAVPPANILK